MTQQGTFETGRVLRIGARRSPLAVAQATWVAERLQALGWRTEFVGITSEGDVDQRALTQIGGTGVFAAAVRARLVSGQIDVAVHSLKDVPTTPVPGLEIAAIPGREDVRDVLVGPGLDAWSALGRPVVLGTGSPRRAAQLVHWAAGRGLPIEVRPVRGNVETRLALVRDGVVDATLLAAAGLRRLGLLAADQPDRAGAPDDPAGEWQGVPLHLLPTDVVLPAPGLGALALECRSDATATVQALATLDDLDARWCVTAERAFLATLEAGCTAPVGTLARVVPDAGAEGCPSVANPYLTLSAMAADDELSRYKRVEMSTNLPPDDRLKTASRLGAGVAREVLAYWGISSH